MEVDSAAGDLIPKSRVQTLDAAARRRWKRPATFYLFHKILETKATTCIVSIRGILDMEAAIISF